MGQGSFGAYSPSKAATSSDIGDGMSNTIMIGESSRGVGKGFVPYRTGWAFGSRGKEVEIVPTIYAHVLISIYAVKSIGEHPINADVDFLSDVSLQNSQCFNSNHTGGAQFAYADGSTKFVDQGIEQDILQSLATMDSYGSYQRSVEGEL